MEDIAIYQAAFWNAVDLRFRELKGPEVRLNIAGLIVPKVIRKIFVFIDSDV